MAQAKKYRDKVLGALLGVAVGDALGAPLEFMTAEQIKAAHGTVRDMLGGGWLDVAPGEITDDTQMTLAVAEGIIENPGDPCPAIGRRFIAWYDSQPKDIGSTCRAAIEAAKTKGAATRDEWLTIAQDLTAATHGQTAGNGALMRTIYPSLYYSVGKSGAYAHYIAGMTHYNMDSFRAITAYNNAIVDIIRRDPRYYGTGFFVDILRNNMRYLQTRTGHKPTGYSIDSLMCAVRAIRSTASFEDALIYAVNLGGDADTIGAITGGAAGAIYGAQEIPQRWTDALDKGILERLIHLADSVPDLV